MIDGVGWSSAHNSVGILAFRWALELIIQESIVGSDHMSNSETT